MIKRKLLILSICLSVPFVDFTGTVASAATSNSQTASVSARASEYDNIGMSIANTYLNIREKATTDSAVVGKLYRGSVATIKSISGNWAKVTSGTVEGYAHTKYLAIGSKAEAMFDEYATQIATVTTNTLRVRKSNTTNSDIIGRVYDGSKHTILSIKSGWAKINYNGTQGWISLDYAKTSYEFKYAEAVGSSSSNTSTSKVTGAKVVEYAKKFLGNPYVYGGTSLTNGADCSGYVQSVYKNFNITLPRTSKQQATAGTKVSVSNIKEGDLVFYADNGVVNHVGIYIGNSQIIHASNAKDGIKISNYKYRTIYTVRRVIS